MHREARITLYGGATLSTFLLAIGAATEPGLGLLGATFAGVTLCMTALCDRVSAA